MQNLGASNRALSGLRSLLALPIYFCQVKGFAELRGMGYNSTNALVPSIMALLPSAEPDTTLVPAVLRYALFVSQDTLIAYLALGGLTLLLCFIVLIIVTIVTFAESADNTPYPTLNFSMKYTVYEGDGVEVTRERLRELDEVKAKDLRRAMGKMKVMPAKDERDLTAVK